MRNACSRGEAFLRVGIIINLFSFFYELEMLQNFAKQAHTSQPRVDMRLRQPQLRVCKQAKQSILNMFAQFEEVSVSFEVYATV
jgi:hypothetical protein